MVGSDLLEGLGYDLASAMRRVRVTTASGVETAPQLVIDRIEALGQAKRQFPVLCHTLPTTINVDGLLGLDFLRGCRVVLDFRSGTVSIE
jgi:predicted aspartyl protease